MDLMEQPFTTSLVPEAWFNAGGGTDKATGERFVQVIRNKDGLPTTWIIRLTTNNNGRTDWRAVSHTTPDNVTITYPRPRNLSHSHIDTALRNMAHAGEWVGTEWSPS